MIRREDRPVSWPLSTASRLVGQRPVFFITVEPALQQGRQPRARRSPSSVPRRLTHFAAQVREDGAVSALCFSKPRKIDLSRAVWTNREEAVTCPRCLKIMGVGKGVTS